MTEPYRIVGALGSPYSCKMRAIFRYRRIPHLWDVKIDPDLMARLRPPVIPKVQFPDGEWHIDSTPMIYDLEADHAERSIIPPDPGLAFLAHLLEDMADEWLTKMMFHYRWYREIDQELCSRWLIYDRAPTMGRDRIAETARTIRDRQVGRMALVGCTEENKPLIEACFMELLAIMEELVTTEPYLFGSRPSMADFGVYGQFQPLSMDPTSADLMQAHAPYFLRWVRQTDDLSGLEGAWRDPDADLPAPVMALLRMAGECYLPFLVANQAAHDAGDETFHMTIRDMPYGQGTYKYQVRCLSELRGRYARLEGAARERVSAVLDATGCLAGGLA